MHVNVPFFLAVPVCDLSPVLQGIHTFLVGGLGLFQQEWKETKDVDCQLVTSQMDFYDVKIIMNPRLC